MELKRYLVLSRDYVMEGKFLEQLGWGPIGSGPGWSAFGAPGGKDGPVEFLSYPPMDGFTAAPGFEVEDLDATFNRLRQLGLDTTEITHRPTGGYFFARDATGRFWQFHATGSSL